MCSKNTEIEMYPYCITTKYSLAFHGGQVSPWHNGHQPRLCKRGKAKAHVAPKFQQYRPFQNTVKICIQTRLKFSSFINTVTHSVLPYNWYVFVVYVLNHRSDFPTVWWGFLHYTKNAWPRSSRCSPPTLTLAASVSVGAVL